MGPIGADVRSALIRQWELIADAVPRIDLSVPSRIAGWRNREVLAHLYAQPYLLVRFLASESDAEPAVRAIENLEGTKAFKDLMERLLARGPAGTGSI